MTRESITVLVIEDGDEYLENLSQFVIGPRYVQAHTGREALEILENQSADVIYLDMRFDRIPHDDLMGDHEKVTRDHNGDPNRAWKYLTNHQGLYILAALKKAGFGDLPVVIAYDFSKEPRRFDNLKRQYPNLRWVSDAVTFKEIQSLLETIVVR
jgi:CheY-like chemotaxis protein